MKEWRREITFIPLRNTPQTSSSTCALCFSLRFIHTALNSALPPDLQSPVSKSFAVIGPITLFRRQISNHLLLYKPTLWGFHPHSKRHWTTPVFSPVSNVVNIIFFSSLCQLQPSLRNSLRLLPTLLFNLLLPTVVSSFFDLLCSLPLGNQDSS